MCRLFGMLASEPTTASFWLLGAPDSVLDQSYENPDGTGLAYYANGGVILEKHPIAAHQDREFASEARRARSHLFLAHVRYATQGSPSMENTQPFAHDSLVFAHNGNIEGLEDLPIPAGSVRGDTDSERYFALLRHHIREASDTTTGIRETVAWIRENRAYTSLNFLLADSERLFALRYPENEELFVRRLEAGESLRGASSYGTRAETRYLHGALLFASEELDSTPSWKKLASGTLAIAHRDLRLELHQI